MPTPFESAQLILKLFELCRDPLMREARTWLVRGFHPDTIDDVKAALASEHNPKLFRRRPPTVDGSTTRLLACGSLS